MAGIYKIGSKLGYDLASGMKAGDSITATDGSIWTMGNDGKIQVNQNGNMLQGVVTYQPTNQQSIAAMKGGAGYSSPYNATLQRAIAGIGSSQWGGWDKDTDESYKAYRKEYLREADRTMQDVLGQYAQNTGGIAGSSAIAAASQAADYQKEQLADKIPELYDAAYGRYMQDVQRQQQYAGLLMDAEQMAQNAYYKQIDYALSKWSQMGYADQEVAGILGVTAGTPTGDQAYTDWSTAFEREQYDNAQQAAAQQKQQRVRSTPRTPGNEKETTETKKTSETEIKEAAAYAAQLISVNGRGSDPELTSKFIGDALTRKGYSDEAIDEAMARVGL